VPRSGSWFLSVGGGSLRKARRSGVGQPFGEPSSDGLCVTVPPHRTWVSSPPRFNPTSRLRTDAECESGTGGGSGRQNSSATTAGGALAVCSGADPPPEGTRPVALPRTAPKTRTGAGSTIAYARPAAPARLRQDGAKATLTVQRDASASRRRRARLSVTRLSRGDHVCRRWHLRSGMLQKPPRLHWKEPPESVSRRRAC
jgi:hypothetical protein